MKETKETKDQQVKSNPDMPLGLKNYKLILLGVALILIGFILMSGGGSEDPNIFNDEMFSARRIIIAPLIMLGGFVLEIYAIMKK